MLAMFACLGCAVLGPDTLRLRVVNEVGEPVPNVEVRWFAEPVSRDEFARFDELGRIDELALASGNVGKTDPLGLLAIEVTSDVCVVGTAPGVWGWGTTKAEAREFELTLGEDRDLVVITVDASGQPVGGVPVKVQMSVHQVLSSSLDSKVWSATTESNTGRAVFKHAAHAIRASRRSPASGESRDWYVGLDCRPFNSGSMRWIEDKIPTIPVMVRAIALTDVDVRVFEGKTALNSGQIFVAEFLWWRTSDWVDGRPPVDQPAQEDVARKVLVGRWGTDARRDVATRCLFAPASSSVDRGSARPLVDGVARLERLLPGTRVSLGYQRNSASDPIWVPFEVPEAMSGSAARSIEIDLDGVTSRSWTTLVVRPTVDGLPIDLGTAKVQRVAGEGLHGNLHTKFWVPAAVVDSVELDGTGRLMVDLRSDLQITAELGVSWSDQRGEREAWIDTRALAGGRSDLGDLELEPSVVAIAGLLLDEMGRPALDVKLLVKESDERELPLGVGVDGSFEFRSNRKVARLLCAIAPGYFPEYLSAIPHGTTDLRIMLSRPVRVSGSLTLGPLASLEHLSVLLLRVEEGQSIDTAPGFSRSCRCGGLFEFEQVRPGSYTLLVRRAGELGKPIELYRREQIVIPNGAEFHLGEIRID